MPTLTRLVLVLIVLAGLGFAVLLALATLVEPQQREISFTVPVENVRPLEGTRP